MLTINDKDWVMSSRSGGNGGTCLQARRSAGQIEIRNSTDPSVSIRLPLAEFHRFLAAAKRGEFDVLR